MNACIRAVVRTSAGQGLKVLGVRRGFSGLMAGETFEMNVRSVANILQRGGTILGTSRSPAFKTPEGRQKAAKVLRESGIDGLIVIGGEGTMRGAKDLMDEHGAQVIGIPGTIDDDLYGAEPSIGFDTAVNTALEAIDRIRDTAASHERLFFVEVMGRRTGFIALEVGLAGGAEAVVVPEVPTDLDQFCRILTESQRRGKTSSIVVVAEGDEAGGAFSLAEQVKARVGIESRVVVLGHIQRGGSPTARDRVLAGRLGAAAVERLMAGKAGVMVGEVAGELVYTPFRETWEKAKTLDRARLELVGRLAG